MLQSMPDPARAGQYWAPCGWWCHLRCALGKVPHLPFSPCSPSTCVAWMETHMWAVASGNLLGAVGEKSVLRGVLQCQWHRHVSSHLARCWTSSLLAATPADESTILSKVLESQRRWGRWRSELKLSPSCVDVCLSAAGGCADPHLSGQHTALVLASRAARAERQVICRAALVGDAAQGIAGFTSGTALGGSLRARREEVTAAAWLRSSKTAEGRKVNKRQTAKERLIGWLPEGLVGVVFLVLTLANFYRIVNLELLPKWGDFRCVFLNKQTWAYLSSLTQHPGIPTGFITRWQACWGKQGRSMAVFEAGHKSLVTPGSRLTD